MGGGGPTNYTWKLETFCMCTSYSFLTNLTSYAVSVVWTHDTFGLLRRSGLSRPPHGAFYDHQKVDVAPRVRWSVFARLLKTPMKAFWINVFLKRRVRVCVCSKNNPFNAADVLDQSRPVMVWFQPTVFVGEWSERELHNQFCPERQPGSSQGKDPFQICRGNSDFSRGGRRASQEPLHADCPGGGLVSGCRRVRTGTTEVCCLVAYIQITQLSAILFAPYS